MRLIDADALLDRIQYWLEVIYGDDKFGMKEAVYHGVDIATREIKNAHTYDGENVKHAAWVPDDDLEILDECAEGYKCSNCGYQIGYSHVPDWSDAIPEEYRKYYCPHCGARMDGKEN